MRNSPPAWPAGALAFARAASCWATCWASVIMSIVSLAGLGLKGRGVRPRRASTRKVPTTWFSRVRLVLERLGGGGGLFDERGVLLRHLVELGDGGVDLADAVALLGGGGGDLADDVGDTLHAGDDLAHGRAGVGDELGAGLHLSTLAPIRPLISRGGFGAALGQAAHLAGDDGEAAALLAGAGGFHRGVQRQDVGLEGDAVDDADDVGDLLASWR